MARWWKAFKTQEERKAFEQEQKQSNPRFKVCMHMTAKQLEKDLCMPKGAMDGFKFVTVYRYMENFEMGEG